MTDVHHDLHHEMGHHEESDVEIAPLFGFAAGLTIVIVVVCFIVGGLFKYYAARAGQAAPAEYPLAVQQGNRLPPEPRLQTDPRGDLRNMRAQEDRILGSYGWVDKNAGTVRIPIDEAMKLTLERGLPSRQAQK